MYITSENIIYAQKNGATTRVRGVTSNEKMKVMVANEHSTYAGSVTGFIQKINGEEVTAQVQIGEFEVLDMSITNETLWVLSNRKEIHELDATSLETKRTASLGYDGTCLAFVQIANEIWVGDKKGVIHALAVDSLEQASQFEGSFQPMMCISAHFDTSTVASGDK